MLLPLLPLLPSLLLLKRIKIINDGDWGDLNELRAGWANVSSSVASSVDVNGVRYRFTTPPCDPFRTIRNECLNMVEIVCGLTWRRNGVHGLSGVARRHSASFHRFNYRLCKWVIGEGLRMIGRRRCHFVRIEKGLMVRPRWPHFHLNAVALASHPRPLH